MRVDDPFHTLPAASGAVRRAVVIGQLGQSLDGRVATVSGESKYIGGAAALDHLHALRAAADAVLVGVGTVVADNPLLTVRRVPGRSPARIVLDPSGRLPTDARCLADDGARRLVIRRAGTYAPLPPKVEEIALPADRDGHIAPAAIGAALAARGLPRILLEGGPRTLAAFLEAGCLDRLQVVVSPVIIGSGRTGLDLSPVLRLSEALRPACRVSVFADGDVLFDCNMAEAKTHNAMRVTREGSDGAGDASALCTAG